MAKASPAEIKELMKATGVGMMECKKAIEEADGDKERQSLFSVKRVSLPRLRRAAELQQRVSLPLSLTAMWAFFSR